MTLCPALNAHTRRTISVLLSAVLWTASHPFTASAQAGRTRAVQANNMRVRIDGLPRSAPLVRVLVQIEATGEQIPRSLPAGVVRSILVPSGLVTVSGDTVVVQRDSAGPAIYVPVETGQLTMPDSGIAVVVYAPITGTIEVRTEGGPPGVSAYLTVQHSCITNGNNCPGGAGNVYTGNTYETVGVAGSLVRIAPARSGVWQVATDPRNAPKDADNASVWCPSPASMSQTVQPGKVSTVTIRFVKRRACS